MEVIIPYIYDPSYLREGGGIRYTHNLVNYLLNNNIPVTLLGVKLTDSQTYKHVDFRFIPILSKSELWLKYFFKLFYKAYLLRFSSSSLIHTQRTYFLLPFIFFYPKNPKICTLHMKQLEFVKIEYPQYFNFVNKVFKKIDQFCLEKIDVIIAINDEVKQSYSMRYPHIKNKIRVISGSGIDLNIFKPLDKNYVRQKYGFKNNENIIVFIGRLETIKNISFLIRSFSLLNNNFCNSKLLIVGRGSKMRDLKELVNDLDLNEKVQFMGEIHPENIPEVYNCANLCALTSYSESSPTVLREALSCGIPMVSVNVGDVSSIIVDPFLGAVVSKYDENLFADKMMTTLKITKENPEISKAKCREVALEKFSFEGIGSRIVEIYQEICRDF